MFSQAERKAEAERRKKQQAADDKAAPASPSSMTSPGELRVTQVGKKPTVCGTMTKAGDLIEFRCAHNRVVALRVFEYLCYFSGEVEYWWCCSYGGNRAMGVARSKVIERWCCASRNYRPLNN